jgi:hypothetical protein
LTFARRLAAALPILAIPVLALTLGAAPALAAVSTVAPSSEPPQAPTGLQVADDNAAGPVTPAPVPDTFLAEVLKTCREAAAGDKGTLARLAADGWAPSVDGDTQTPFYQSFSGEKDFADVGTADISFSQEVYPTMTEGYCSISIDSALRQVGIDDLKKMPEYTGQVVENDSGVASTWEVKGANPPVYIQIDQHTQDLYFILDVTTLIPRPAAQLPYVQPDVTNDNQDQNLAPEPGDGADSTNAGN